MNNKYPFFVYLILFIIFTFPGNNLIAKAESNGVSAWSGKWVINKGEFEYSFIVNDNKVTGSINRRNGWQFVGTISKNVLTGEWSEPPFTTPNHKGREIITISDDGKTITGKWKYGIENSVNDSWVEFTGTHSNIFESKIKITLSLGILIGGVKLSWDKEVNSALIKGYNIYRGNFSKVYDEEPINDSLISINSTTENNSFIDFVGEKKIYYYICKAVFNDNTISEPSNEVIAYVGDTGKSIKLTVNNPNITVNGETLEIDPNRGTTPVIIDNRILVPIRSVVRVLGGKVQWDEGERKITIKQGLSTIQLWIDKKKF